MVKKDIAIVIETPDSSLTFDQLCEVCLASPSDIKALIEFQIIEPIGEESSQWQFNLAHLQRVKKALRLQRDLEVNYQGIAIVLDLLEEMKRMRERIQLLENIFSHEKNEDEHEF